MTSTSWALADPVDAAQPLLDLHGVPRKVEVDHGVAELEIAPLPGRLGGHEHVGVVPEGHDGCLLLTARQAPVVAGHRHTRTPDEIGDEVEGVAERGEDDHLLGSGAMTAHHLEERGRLLGDREPPSLSRQLVPSLAVEPRCQGRGARTSEASDAAQGHRPGWCRAPSLDAHTLGHLAVQLGLLRSGCDPVGARQAAGQHERDVAATVAHHHLPQSGVQAAEVASRLWTVPGAVAVAELARRTQVPGAHEGHELVEVAQAVLHGRGGEEDEMAGTQGAGQTTRGPARVAHPVSLIDHDQVPLGAGHGIEEWRAAGGRDRGDDHRMVAVALGRGPAAALGHDRGEGELAVELLLPLLDEAGGGEHQGRARQAPQPQLAKHEGGLDRLAQAHLVGEDGPTLHGPKHPGGGSELVGEGLEAQAGQRDERVEARPRPDRERAFDEPRSDRVDRLAAGEAVEQRRVGAELGEPAAPVELGTGLRRRRGGGLRQRHVTPRMADV